MKRGGKINSYLKLPLKTLMGLPLIFFMLLLGLPDDIWAAKSQKGSTGYVTLQDVGLVSGELLAVKEASLVVYQKATDQGLVIDISRIAFIKVDRKTQVGIGALVGAVIGTMPLAIRFVTGNIGHEFSEYSFLYYLPTVMAAGVGALIGCLFSFDIQVELQGKSPGEIKNILDELQRYAREPRPIPGQGAYPSASTPIPRDQKPGVLLKEKPATSRADEGTEKKSSETEKPAPKKPARPKWNRFHFLWLPGSITAPKPVYLQDISGSLPAAVAQPSDVPVRQTKFTLAPEQEKLRGNEHFRLEYSLKKWLNLSLEYMDLGILQYYSTSSLELLEGETKANGWFYSHDKLEARNLLLGLVWRTAPDLFKNFVSIQLSGGVGLCWSKITSNISVNYKGVQIRRLNKFNLALQVSSGVDYFFGRKISIGMGVGYYYIPLMIPGLQATNSIEYYMDDPNNPTVPLHFSRTTTVAMPDCRINLVGFTYGARIGIHF